MRIVVVFDGVFRAGRNRLRGSQRVSSSQIGIVRNHLRISRRLFLAIRNGLRVSQRVASSQAGIVVLFDGVSLPRKSESYFVPHGVSLPRKSESYVTRGESLARRS